MECVGKALLLTVSSKLVLWLVKPYIQWELQEDCLQGLADMKQVCVHEGHSLIQSLWPKSTFS